ncbi:unnamed protein product [Rhizophagus irregularis]|nr:unnamed protein product [Rhizophagus irregularis]
MWISWTEFRRLTGFLETGRNFEGTESRLESQFEDLWPSRWVPGRKFKGFWFSRSWTKEFEGPSSHLKELRRLPFGELGRTSKVQNAKERILILQVSETKCFGSRRRKSRTPKDFNFEEFSTWFSGSHLDWTGFRRLTASCNPPEKNFEDASWMKFRRSRMLPDFHIEGKGSRKTSSGLPYRRSQVPI